jgi:hypothetical protein
MSLGQLNNEVDTNDVPLICWSIQGVKFSVRSTVLQLHLVVKVTCFDVDSNISGHLWPPVVVCYKLKCLEVACMSSDACIMMLLNNTTLGLCIWGYIFVVLSHCSCHWFL